MTSTRPYTFPREEPGAAGHLELVEALKSVPAQVRDLLAGLPDDTLRRPAPDGGWSITEIAGHVHDYAGVEYRRLYMMATQNDPVLPAFDHDASVREHDYRSAPLAPILDDMAAHRAQSVELLTTLVNWNWARSGQHPVNGRISIRQYVEDIIHHNQTHLADIARLRGAGAGDSA